MEAEVTTWPEASVKVVKEVVVKLNAIVLVLKRGLVLMLVSVVFGLGVGVGVILVLIVEVEVSVMDLGGNGVV
jgi:hypothetical protein